MATTEQQQITPYCRLAFCSRYYLLLWFGLFSLHQSHYGLGKYFFSRACYSYRGTVVYCGLGDGGGGCGKEIGSLTCEGAKEVSLRGSLICERAKEVSLKASLTCERAEEVSLKASLTCERAKEVSLRGSLTCERAKEVSLKASLTCERAKEVSLRGCKPLIRTITA